MTSLTFFVDIVDEHIVSALLNGIAKTEKDYLLYADTCEDESGACVNIVLVSPSKIYVANLGDCRTILLKRTEKNCLKPIALSRDHRAVIEKTRVKRCGGFVMYGRLNGRLLISRSIGDRLFKTKVNLTDDPDMVYHVKNHDPEALLLIGKTHSNAMQPSNQTPVPFSQVKHGSSNPSISTPTVNNHFKRSSSLPTGKPLNESIDMVYCYDPYKKKSKFVKEKPPQFTNLLFDSISSSNPEITVVDRGDDDYILVNGSDGLYDYFSNKKISKYATVFMGSSKQDDMQQLSENLCHKAYVYGSEDDITCVCMKLVHKPEKEVKGEKGVKRYKEE